ncbi:Tetratricopeptide-like helical domain superfamily [Sesbania bispinosa]|nr:Tetratricopeptide-like helical domain superfamily [Sesbania bispinosa]
MRQTRFAPDVKSYTILLRVNEVCWEMEDDSFEPDVVTYGIIINAYCKAKKYDEAIRFYHKMQAKSMGPTPHIYYSD